MDQLQEFIVSGIVIEWQDRHSLLELVAERVDGIVHKYYILYESVPYDAQVLDVDTLGCLDAVLPVESGYLSLRVEELINNSVGISLV